MTNDAFTDYWALLARLSDIQRVRSRGIDEVLRVQRQRLQTLVNHARERSRFYRERYRSLSSQPALGELSPVGKRALMNRFDDWVSVPELTRANVEAFVSDPRRVGQPLFERFTVWKSSGTSGEPGLFVQDAPAALTYQALVGVQLQTKRLATPYGLGLMRLSGRAALLTVTDEHFASVVYWRSASKGNPWSWTRDFSIMAPLSEWVAALNEFSPAYVASYPSVLKLLAHEKRAGRLAIAPLILWSGGEHLSIPMRVEIEQAFGCPVIDEYGASECLSIGFGCPAGWLHVNADWVIVEPVDCNYRPVPPGQLSDTVLVTNLANRTQPIIRYDLGDRVVRLDGACACGNPLPAIRVQGRSDDLVTLVDAGGRPVTLLPLALTTVVEEHAKVYRFQIVQQGPTRIALRVSEPERDRAGFAVEALRRFLAAHGLGNAEVVVDTEAPRCEAASGKLRQVLADAIATPYEV